MALCRAATRWALTMGRGDGLDHFGRHPTGIAFPSAPLWISWLKNPGSFQAGDQLDQLCRFLYRALLDGLL